VGRLLDGRRPGSGLAKASKAVDGVYKICDGYIASE
jgi:hypothetical protein